MIADPSRQAPQDEYSPFTNLVTSHALGVLKTKVRDYEAHLAAIKAGSVRSAAYPDGSLLIEGGNSFRRFRDLIIRNQMMTDGGICDSVGFLSLNTFPDKTYALWLTTDYREGLGDLGFHVWFPKLHTYPTKDYRVDNLQITVEFKRRPSTVVRGRFARFLGNWFQSVASQGLFSDGPVKRISENVQFRGRLAQFRLDAGHSGQDTLNWLLLCVLNFGYTVAPVQQFIFDQESQMEIFVGPLDPKLIETPISQVPGRHESSSCFLPEWN